MSEKILAFIPCFNCEDRIGATLARLQGPIARRFDEILVLDDHSDDDTLAQAITASALCETPRVTVALNIEKYDLGGSHKAAFAYARGEGFTHVVVLHGDDRGDIMDLATVLSQGLHRRFDACLGSGFAPGVELPGLERHRALGSRVVNALSSLATRRRVLDLGAGPNIFAVGALDHAALARYPDDVRFNFFLLLGLLDRGRTTRFFPVNRRETRPVALSDLKTRGLKTLGVLADFVFRRGRFRASDYRQKRRASYEFEVAHARCVETAARRRVG